MKEFTSFKALQESLKKEAPKETKETPKETKETPKETKETPNSKYGVLTEVYITSVTRKEKGTKETCRYDGESVIGTPGRIGQEKKYKRIEGRYVQKGSGHVFILPLAGCDIPKGVKVFKKEEVIEI